MTEKNQHARDSAELRRLCSERDQLRHKVAEQAREISEANADFIRKANEAEQLRAELAAAKETIMRYETTAENCDLLRAELAAIKGQVPDIARFEKHAMKARECLSECDVVLLSSIRRLIASPAPSAVVMPAVPDGYKLVPIEPTAAQCFTAAFNLCNEFGEEVVRDNKQFAMAAYRWLVAASPAAKGAKP